MPSVDDTDFRPSSVIAITTLSGQSIESSTGSAIQSRCAQSDESTMDRTGGGTGRLAGEV